MTAASPAQPCSLARLPQRLAWLLACLPAFTAPRQQPALLACLPARSTITATPAALLDHCTMIAASRRPPPAAIPRRKSSQPCLLGRSPLACRLTAPRQQTLAAPQTRWGPAPGCGPLPAQHPWRSSSSSRRKGHRHGQVGGSKCNRLRHTPVARIGVEHPVESHRLLRQLLSEGGSGGRMCGG